MPRSTTTGLVLLRGMITAGLVMMQVSCVGEPEGDGPWRTAPKGTEPDEGSPCPAGRPHLVLGVRSNDYTRGSRIVRRDEHLDACRGVEIRRDLSDVTAVGGTSSGRDLAGFENGQVVLLDGDAMVWMIENGDRFPVGAVFTIQYQGREVAVVLWATYGGSWAEYIELLDLETHATLRHFDVSFSILDAARPVDGSADRIATEYDSDGIQHYRIDAAGDTLATGGERQIPRGSSLTGVFSDLSVDAGVALITARSGVMYWQQDASPAFVGPVACVWPAHVGDPLPEPDHDDYIAAVPDRVVPGTFLVVVEGRIPGASRDSTYLYRMSHRGECALLIEASTDDFIESVAWSGV